MSLTYYPRKRVRFRKLGNPVHFFVQKKERERERKRKKYQILSVRRWYLRAIEIHVFSYIRKTYVDL